jgi:hypothetical protein
MKQQIENKKFIDWLKQYNNKPLPEWDDYVNIIGIRNDLDQDLDVFNDVILLQMGEDIYSFKGTTDPGKYWTGNATKEWGVAGVAHLLEGWYPKTYCLGNHMGEKALVQYGAPVTVWRDVDKDYIYDPEVDTVQTGYFGINIHYTKYGPEFIGRWSAGCQVIQHREDWEMFINSVIASGEKWFNYLLLNIKEIPEEFKHYGRN